MEGTGVEASEGLEGEGSAVGYRGEGVKEGRGEAARGNLWLLFRFAWSLRAPEMPPQITPILAPCLIKSSGYIQRLKTLPQLELIGSGQLSDLKKGKKKSRQKRKRKREVNFHPSLGPKPQSPNVLGWKRPFTHPAPTATRTLTHGPLSSPLPLFTKSGLARGCCRIP